MFKYGENTVEVVPEYVYFGFKKMYGNTYPNAMKTKTQIEQARTDQFS